jgi:hypothetical protein
MDQTEWVILDTETDGLRYPIHTLEVAAQKKRGIHCVGAPFRVFLNHDIPIPADAFAIHGYTRDFLKEHGIAPVEAYEQLRAYVEDRYVVAHYMAYDWNAVLLPEWRRLRIPHIGKQGFCSWRLTRRVLHELRSHSLDFLRESFGFPRDAAHTALGDVGTVYLLLSETVFPRLAGVNVTTFDLFAQFCNERIFKCHCLLQGKDYQEELRKIRAAKAAEAEHKRLLLECIEKPDPSLWLSRGLLTEGPEISFAGKRFQFTGKMVYGSRPDVCQILESVGGLVKETKNCSGVDYLILGEDLEKGWTRLCNGGKISDAIHRKIAQPSCQLQIALESDFIDALMNATHNRELSRVTEN